MSPSKWTFRPGFASRAKHLILLTGTPITNRPAEVFPLVQALYPDRYPSFFTFAKRYCAAHQVTIGRERTAWDFSGASNLPELRERLKDVMVRREKAQVLTELPAKRRVSIDVELTNRDEYDAYLEEAEEALEAALEVGDTSRVLATLNALRRLAGRGKLATAIEWTRNFLEGGASLVVFAHHKDLLDELQAALEAEGVAVVRVDGDTPIAARQAAVDAFQAGTARVFLGTPGAAGVGLTLTRASDVLFCEREWAPAVEEQAEDRCNRIGQTESCTAWYLHASDTIDEKFAALVDQKRAVIAAALGGTAIESSSLVMDLARQMVEERKARKKR